MLYYVKLNDKKYGVEVADQIAVLQSEEKLSMADRRTEEVVEEHYEVEDIPDLDGDVEDEKVSTIVASMPGAVLEVFVEEGDEVKEGQILAVYESMKMENEVVATTSGKVKSVNIKKGDTIKIDQVLFVFNEN